MMWYGVMWKQVIGSLVWIDVKIGALFDPPVIQHSVQLHFNKMFVFLMR